MTEKKAYLYLDSERFFEGFSVGKNADTCGEVVFNTSMSGYQEIISDPSYTDQIINFTYPHIGNVGTNDDDLESDSNGCNGVIIRDPSTITSNWRKQDDLSNFLKTKNISGIYGIDTRKVTRIIRNEGAKVGAIVSGKDHKKKALKLIEEFVPLGGKDLASVVSTKKVYEWKEPSWRKDFDDNNLKIVAIDFGVKHNILRMLKDRGFQVIVVPAKTTAAEIIAMMPDGVFLSNGPGDPEPCKYAIECIKELRTKRIPMFGICLGHQCIGYSFNSKIIRAKNIMHGKTSMISHNKQTIFKGLKVPYHVMRYHSLIIDSSTLHKDFEIIASVQENSEEIIMAIKHNKYNLFGVQFHPESIFSEQGNKIIANFLEIVNEQ